ncbi:MAG: hypothetical protein ACREOW_10565 [Thermodesulfobacteriota bacterium]
MNHDSLLGVVVVQSAVVLAEVAMLIAEVELPFATASDDGLTY